MPPQIRNRQTHRWLAALVHTWVILASAIVSGQTSEVDSPSSEQIAAMEHFRSGIVALRGGKTDEAIKQFDRAIRIKPATADFHAAQSAAYLQKKNLGFAWDAARKAYALGPPNARVADQLVAVWSALGDQGVFLVGTPAERIQKALGAPDRANQKATNERWIYGCLAIDFSDGVLFSTIDLRGYKPELQHNSVRLAFRPDPGIWKVKQRTISRLTSTTEFDPVPGVAAPASSLLIQRIHGIAATTSPRKWMEQARRESAPPDIALDWRVLEEDSFGLLYQWSLPRIGQAQAHWELTRVLRGPRDLYRISLISDKTLASDEAVVWQETFRKARLLKPTDARD